MSKDLTKFHKIMSNKLIQKDVYIDTIVILYF